MQIDEIRKLAQQNFVRCSSIMSAIAEKINIDIKSVDEMFLLSLSPADTAEILGLLQSIRYCMEQAEIINTELLRYHWNGLTNFDIAFKDEKSSDDEKLKLLSQMVETAMQFIPPDVKEYLELKKNRVYSIIKKQDDEA